MNDVLIAMATKHEVMQQACLFSEYKDKEIHVS